MYCPKCRVEYRDGFLECVDCRVALVSGAPPQTEPDTRPGLELVTVLESNDPSLIAFAEVSLDDAGIPFYSMDEIGSRVDGLSFFRPSFRIQVTSDHEAEARALLQAIDELEGPARE